MAKDIIPDETQHNQKDSLLLYLPWLLLAFLLALGVILYFCGFRFSYNPNLENSWNAVSAVAGWASAIASIGAVAVAVIVALKQNKLASEQNRLATMQNNIAESQNKIALQQAEIMEQQNKITLFDKRYEAYSEIVTLGSFAESIKGGEYLIDDSELTFQRISHKRLLICTVFGSIFGIPIEYKTSDKAKELETFLAKLNERRNKAYMLPLLLPLSCEEKAEMKMEITDMYDTMYELLSETIVTPPNCDINDKNRIDLVEKCEMFFEKYRDIFYKYLSYQIEP